MSDLNPEKYGSLLASRLPREIASDEENQARLQELETLLFLSESLTPEEEAYCKVLTILVEHYERKYRLPVRLDSIQTVRVLLDSRGMKEGDLVPILGDENHVADILQGQRELSHSHIQKLCDFFDVSPEVFYRS